MTGGTETATGAGGTTGARVVRGGLWKMLANALPQLYTLVLSIAAARYLGSSGMGRQSFIAFVEAATITLLSASFSPTYRINASEKLAESSVIVAASTNAMKLCRPIPLEPR